MGGSFFMSPDLSFDWESYIDYAEEIFNTGDLDWNTASI